MVALWWVVLYTITFRLKQNKTLGIATQDPPIKWETAVESVNWLSFRPDVLRAQEHTRLFVCPVTWLLKHSQEVISPLSRLSHLLAVRLMCTFSFSLACFGRTHFKTKGHVWITSAHIGKHILYPHHIAPLDSCITCVLPHLVSPSDSQAMHVAGGTMGRKIHCLWI